MSLTPRLDKIEAGRNLIINGNFDFWQRGTSFAAITHTSYSADRWKYTKAGTTAVHTVSRSTAVPTLTQSGFSSSYSLKIQPTTADAAVAAGDASTFLYHVEGYDFNEINGKKVTLQFWVRSNKAGTYSVAFRSGTNSRSYVVPYSILSTDTWERKSITLQMENWSSVDTNLESGVGLNINFTLMSGTTTQTASINQWISGTFISGTSQVNFNDSTSNTWELSQVMLFVGETNPDTNVPFSRSGKVIQQELAMCQRYYEKSYNTDDDPGMVLAYPGSCTFRSNGTMSSVEMLRDAFRVEKRRNPVMKMYSPQTGAVDCCFNFTAGADRGGSYTNAGRTGAWARYTDAPNPAADGNFIYWHWTADAEL